MEYRLWFEYGAIVNILLRDYCGRTQIHAQALVFCCVLHATCYGGARRTQSHHVGTKMWWSKLMPKQRLVMRLRSRASCGLCASCSVRCRKTRQNWHTADTKRASRAVHARCTSAGAPGGPDPLAGTCTAALRLHAMHGVHVALVQGSCTGLARQRRNVGMSTHILLSHSLARIRQIYQVRSGVLSMTRDRQATVQGRHDISILKCRLEHN